jgi:outer membrane protein TolC
VEIGFAYREPGFGNMLSVMVAMDLPWQKERRQDRDIAAKLAEVDQVRAMREQARRVAEADLRAGLADHAAAGGRIERYRASLIPLAKERAAAALAAFEGGRGALAEVLTANQAVLESELELVALEAERARTWARLKFLFDRGDAT